MKIISLVPSITETLFDFGLTSDEVIGRTKFCIHPSDFVSEVEVIGGTKNLNIAKIKSLKPDLIIANKEENEKIQVEELMADFKVWVTDIKTLEDNAKFLSELGLLLNKEEVAKAFNQKIETIVQENKVKFKTKKVAYIIWKNPLMTVGGDTFISNVLHSIGFENMFNDRDRYPEINLPELESADSIFLSSEPYPFKEKHLAEFLTKFPEKQVLLVDGEAFSWFGTHLAKTRLYFKNLI